MNIDAIVAKAAALSIKNLYGVEIAPEELQIQNTRPEFKGHKTLVVFPLSRYTKKKPEEGATEIGQNILESGTLFSDFEVVKGFLNLTIKDELWFDYLKNKESASAALPQVEAKSKIMVEYSSPNTNKPLHLGHIRNNLLGYSVSEILKEAGHELIKSNLINDRGIHICKSMLAWMKFGEGETPKSSGLKGDHLAGKYYVLFDKEYRKEQQELIEKGLSEEEAKNEAPLIKEARELLKKWEEGDAETVRIWKMMNQWVYDGFDITYATLGVDFDKFYYESETYLLGKDLIKEGLEKGVFYKKDDGSVWIDLSDDGLDEKLVLRADGTSVYMTQDMGTAELKYQDYGIDRSIYVVGNEQDYHFKVLQLIMQKLGSPYADGIYHLSYGMVDLPTGKMKSREGTVVDADDLMQEMFDTARKHTEESGKVDDFGEEEKEKLFRDLGLGALKFYILKADPKKRMLFNPDESIDFQGFTGPFVQYTHARIKSVLRKAESEQFIPGASFERNFKMVEDELELLRVLSDFDSSMQDAIKGMSPAVVANYVYLLAKTYNKFYHNCSILREENQSIIQFRVNLSHTVAAYVKYCLRLLGIHAPERM